MELDNTWRGIFAVLIVSWPLKQEQRSIVISQQALTTWLSEYCVKLACQKALDEDKGTPSIDASHADDKFTIMNDDIRCIHGYLDPDKAMEMKRISEVGPYLCTGIPIYHSLFSSWHTWGLSVSHIAHSTPSFVPNKSAERASRHISRVSLVTHNNV